MSKNGELSLMSEKFAVLFERNTSSIFAFLQMMLNLLFVKLLPFFYFC